MAEAEQKVIQLHHRIEKHAKPYQQDNYNADRNDQELTDCIDKACGTPA